MLRFQTVSSHRSANLIFLCFATLLLVALFLTSCETAKPLSGDRKILRDLLGKASTANANDDYSAASKYLVRAVVLAEDLEPSMEKSIRKRLCDTYLDWARALYWKSKTDNSTKHLIKALRLCDKAAAVYPRSKRKCDIFATKFRADLNTIRYKKSTSLETLDPEYKERSYKIHLALKQASILRKAGDLTMARDKLEEALLLDPYNIQATRGLREIMRSLATAGKRRATADKETRIAEVAWKNVAPIQPPGNNAKNVAESTSALDLQERLKNWRVAEIDFNDAPLDQAFAMLGKEIRESVSKSFTLNYKSFSPSDKKWPNITFKAKDVPVLDALKSICAGVGLKMSVTDCSVDISPE